MVELLCITCAYIWMFLWLSKPSHSPTYKIIEEWQKHLTEIRRCFVLGDSQRLMQLVNSGDHVLFPIAKSAYFVGIPWGDALVFVSREILKTSEILMEEDRVKQLLLHRIYFVMGLAVLGRWGLWSNEITIIHDGFSSGLDTFGPLVGIGMVTLFWGVGSGVWFPGSWLWNGAHLSEEGLAWLRISAGLPAPHGQGQSWFVVQVNQLIRQETLTGVSEEACQRLLLEEWAMKRNHQDRIRLNQVLEWMPLAELFGLGLPLACFFSGYLLRACTQGI